MNFSKKSIIVSVFSIGADFLTYYQSLSNFAKDHFGEAFPSWGLDVLCIIESLVFWAGLAVLILVIAYNVLKHYFTHIGTHQIPCTIYNMYKYKFTPMNETILRILHRDLYHKVYFEKRKIEELKIKDFDDARPRIMSVVQQFHDSLYQIFKLDLSISIKTITKQDSQTCLKQYLHFRSSQESKIDGKRYLNNVYLLTENESDDLSVYASLAKTHVQRHGNQKYKKNSIYDYILATNHNSWMSNDLGIDTKNGIFYSSSSNYKTYYNSLAVFAIIPPECETDRGNLIKGILIFDSIKTSLFSEKECNWLMGYMAHLIYELFQAIEDNNGQSEKGQSCKNAG